MGAVGAVGATMLVATYAAHRRAWSFAAICGAGFGISLMGLGLAPTYAFGMVAMVFVGGLASAFQSLNNSICMQMTDPDYTGRVQSINMLSWSFFGIAALPIGIFADAVGLADGAFHPRGRLRGVHHRPRNRRPLPERLTPPRSGPPGGGIVASSRTRRRPLVGTRSESGARSPTFGILG